MNIILLHGQGRTTNAMRLLGFRLGRLGYCVKYFRYYTRREKFTQIVERLIDTVRSLPQDEPYAFVGHSMGGVIARASLPALTDHTPTHLIMLASPSQPPKLAPLARHNPLYTYLTYECGQLVTSDAFYQRLPKPTVPTTIIAGTGGPRGKWFPLGQEANDSVLTVQETRLGSEYEMILVPALHTFIMNSREALHHIDRILKQAP
jgi:pimeloyl-ACP methyl ester carboxylesterase